MSAKVAIVGHSHIRRLEEYLDGNNLRLPRANIDIRFFSRGGLTVPGLFDPAILTPLLMFQPQALVLSIGDNDINPFSSPHQICHDIFTAINSLMQACPSIRFVSISQILPRHLGTSRFYFEGYNNLARTLNTLLLQECINAGQPTTLRFCRYNEFEFNPVRLGINQSLYLPDGVHLNSDGYKILADRFRGVVTGIHKKMLTL